MFIKLILLLAFCGALVFTNPGLEVFSAKIEKKVKDDRNFLETGVGFLRKITGVTALKQKTGLKAFYVCRRNFYAGSLYLFKKSSPTNETYLAAGLGILTFLPIVDFEKKKESQIVAILKELEFKQCKDFSP